MSLKQFVDQNIVIATKTLEMQGHFSPQVVLLDEEGKMGLALLAIDKAFWNGAIRKVVQDFKAKYVILIVESWFIEAQKKEEIVLPVHAHPFRKEALVLTAYSKAGEKDIALIPFEHVDTKTIKTEEPKRDIPNFESNVFENPWV